MREDGGSPGRVSSSVVHAARRAVAWSLAAAALLAFPGPAPCAESPRVAPHSHFRLPESCPKCHLAGRDGRPDPARFSPEADSLCLGCHRQGSLGRTHPMDVRPADRYGKGKIPADLPLSDDGRMLCLTCHASHGPFLSAVRAVPGQKPEEPARGNLPFRTFFLRRAGAERGALPLCEACHRMPR